MIKNIVLDMGNVMIYFDRDLFLDNAGVTDPADRALLKREIYLSLEWSMMDRGSLNDAQAAAIFAKRLPEHLKPYASILTENWDRPIAPIRGMAELVRELKGKGYGVYLLSNASYHQHDYWDKVPGAEYFDGTLISADVRLVKPQPEIYLLLCSKFSLRAEECVFIDDSTSNVEGAVYSGMQGIVFHDDVRELRQQLRAHGVDCAPEG